MSLFLGVDAGGTSTTYVLTDGPRVVAFAGGGSIKRLRVAEDAAAANLNEALNELEARGGVSLRQVTRTCIGAAGVTVPLVSEWLTTRFAERVGGELLLVGDVEIALDAAFPGERGVLVLAGTGSNVAARAGDGRLTGAGGWGPAVADEGSGFSIGRDAVRALFRTMDADEYTSLRERIPAFWEVDEAELVGLVNATPAPDFARLVPVVAEAAFDGDSVAAEVLRAAGEALAQTALVAMARLRKLEGRAWPGSAPVAFAGSVLRHVAPVREAVEDALRRSDAAVRILPEVVDPVKGALWRASGGAIAGGAFRSTATGGA